MVNTLKKYVFMMMIAVALLTATVFVAAAAAPTEPLAQLTAQTTEDSAKADVRFVATIDSLAYDEVGFIVSYHPFTGVDLASANFAPVQSGVSAASIDC